MLRADERSKEISQKRDNKSENLGHQKKEEMRYKEQDTPQAGWGQAPGAGLDTPSGKLRCWADCVQGPGVKLQESGENAWGQRGTGNRAGLEGKCKGESRDGKPGEGPPLEARLWALLSGSEGVGWELEAGVRTM